MRKVNNSKHSKLKATERGRSVVNESCKATIAKLINSISVQNYAETNKYLKQAIEQKIKSRIDKATDTPLF